VTFDEALKRLNIEDYEDRIFNSSSRGELFHVYDYIMLAETFDDEQAGKFREWFEVVVKGAEGTWRRPESVFQHIPKILREALR